jgi:hypothetical protein
MRQDSGKTRFSNVVPRLTRLSKKELGPIIDLLKLIACLWLWEACGIAIMLSLYRMEGERNVLEFFSHKGGKVFVVATVLFGLSSVLVALYCFTRMRERKSLRLAIVKWNLVPLISVITIIEIILRVFSVETSWGTMLGQRQLGPRRLQISVRNYSEKSNEILYYDQLLGWNVRPNLSSSDGLYFTGVEGIRSLRSGIILGDNSANCRIALIGDSHTFGHELKHEETWGYHLQEYLPIRCQVLNFGVGGYSVGQMYLRYLRDVRPWHPDVVILALSSDSAGRTMGVYGLNMFADSIPWAQPRFELREHDLLPINIPLPPLEVITSANFMSDLPYIDDDRFFIPGRWELPRWRYLYNSYLFRLYVTWFPLHRRQHNEDSADAINHELLRSFIRKANSDGATPVFLYLPDKDDYKDPAYQPSLRTLVTSEIEFFDLRPCLDGIDANIRFIPHGGHYSLQGSMAIARCIAKLPPLKVFTSKPAAKSVN